MCECHCIDQTANDRGHRERCGTHQGLIRCSLRNGLSASLTRVHRRAFSLFQERAFRHRTSRCSPIGIAVRTVRQNVFRLQWQPFAAGSELHHTRVSRESHITHKDAGLGRCSKRVFVFKASPVIKRANISCVQAAANRVI